MFHIYGMDFSFNTTKLLFVAEELGIEYGYTQLDLSKGEHKTPEHLARHPLGKLPTLEHDGKHLFESAAICQYMASVAESPMYPVDHFERAQVNQWMDYFSIHAGRWLGVLLFERFVRGAFGMGEKNLEQEKEAEEFLGPQLAVVDAQLGKHAYIAGDTVTIADCHAYAYLEKAPMADVSLDAYPNLKRWCDKFSQRPGVKRVNERIATDAAQKAA